MKIVVDVDNTLCVTNPGVPYSEREPKLDVIETLREYHSMGVYIIIETARQQRTHEGNIGKRNIHTLPILIAWLDKHGVPYDEIRLNKVWEGDGGFRVDDKSVRPREFVGLSYDEIMELLKK